MKEWISRLRAQKTKLRLRQSERLSSHGAPRIWDHDVTGLFLAFLAWLLTCLLAYAGRPIPADPAQLLHFSSDGVFLLISLVISVAFLRILAPSLRSDSTRSLVLLILLALLTLIPTRLLLHLGKTMALLPQTVMVFFLPLAFGPLLATILIGSGAGLALGIWISLAAALFADRSFAVLLCGLIAAGIAAGTARNLRKRARIFKIGLIIGCAQIYAVFASAAFTQEESLPILLAQTAGCLINGTAAVILTLLVLPLLEAVFGITTDITLLELSDLGHPILQRLAMEAPGTYHHSLMVANLAQAAADDIGANALLVRVAAYFHDIGKLTKPDLFSENIQMHANPHDDLSPNMSALLITAHVKEGISIAMLSKLPRVIIDILQQHHGTSLVTYFHHKAREQLMRDDGNRNRASTALNEGDFRYAGPKPASREAAIILLADAVEAASRSLAKPTPHHIRNLVDEIVADKMQDGQLDDCSMTFAQLRQVRESFIFTLANMAHSRIPYPKNDNRHHQPAEH